MPREYREQRMVRVLREQLYENIQGMQEAFLFFSDSGKDKLAPGLQL